MSMQCTMNTSSTLAALHGNSSRFVVLLGKLKENFMSQACFKVLGGAQQKFCDWVARGPTLVPSVRCPSQRIFCRAPGCVCAEF